MKKTKILWGCTLLLCITIAACSNNEDGGSFTSDTIAQINLMENESRVADAQNEFAFKFIERTYNENSNNLFSPITFYSAVGMFANGAANETLDEIEEALLLSQHGMNVSDLNSFCKTMLTGLNQSGRDAEIRLSNSLWFANGFPVYSDYSTTVKEWFNPQIETLDFTNKKSVSKINSWAALNSNNLIKELLKEGEVGENTSFVGISLLYLKFGWKEKFSKSDTGKKDFHNSDGSISNVDMMIKKNASGYYSENSDWQSLNLLLKGPFYIQFAIPQSETLEKKISQGKSKSINELSYKSIPNKQDRPEGLLWMPKFEADFHMELIPELSKMGMELPFDPDNADFSKLSQIPTNITRLFQDNVIKFSEEGVEAASATTFIDVQGASGGYYKRPDFKLDKPFLYIVRDIRTDAILFIGVVNRL